MSHAFTLRQATDADVEQLIDLMLVSSWGGMQKAWERVAPKALGWRGQARAELRDLSCDLGLPNFVVAAQGDRLAGMILFNFFDDMAYVQPEDAAPELRETLVLLKQAANSIFIREIGVAQFARGTGVGRGLLTFADTMWEPHVLDRLTLLVNSENLHAMRVYAGRGFVEAARAPSTDHPGFSDLSYKILMEKRKSWAAADGRSTSDVSAKATGVLA